MKLRFSALCSMVLLAGPWLKAQYDCSFDLGPDTMLCHGQYLLLHAPAGALSWAWGNGVQAQTISTDSSGTYVLSAVFPGTGGNVVQNGDFSAGGTGFTTDLALGTGGSWGLLSLEGTYGISTSAGLLHNNFPDCGDHTGGGNMLVVNGSNVAGQNIWCSDINVEPNTTYAFTAWLASVRPENPAVLQFSVNGQVLGAPLMASEITCEWAPFHAVWSSGTNTTAGICIVNQNLAGDGNDFALDDISFSPLCTWTDSVEVVILPVAPAITVEGAGPVCPGSTLALEAELLGEWPLNDVAWTWSDGTQGASTTVNGPGMYEVSAQGRCLYAETSVEVTVDTCTATLRMPNVFSPNGDGVNDTFGPIVEGSLDRYHMEVRNRWGQLVFTSEHVDRRWNGRMDGSTVPSGTYYWIVRYATRDANGSLLEDDVSGHVTLLDGR